MNFFGGNKYKLYLIVTLTTLIVLGIALTGCSSSRKKTAPSNEDPKAVSETEKMYIAIIDGYLNKIPAEQPGTLASAEDQATLVKKMVNLYKQNASSQDLNALYIDGITKLSPNQADKFTAYAIAGMERNSFNDYSTIEKYSNDPDFFARFTGEAQSVDNKYVTFNQQTENIKDPGVKGIVQNAKNQGYYVASAEGMLYYLVDFTQFAKYRQYNTKPMASLLETLAIDCLDPMTSDAAFIVNGDTLAARTYGIEKMLTDYKGSLYEQFLAVRFKEHINMLFFGVNNTPNFSYETNIINEKIPPLFKNIETLDGTFMAQLVKEFSTLVKANQGKLDDVTREKADNILKAIDVKYGLTEKIEMDYGQWISGNAVVE